MKNLLILSSRTTNVGSFRKDVIYSLDETDIRVSAVIESLTKGEKPAAKVLTEKEVAAFAKKAKDFKPKAEGKAAAVKVRDAQEGEAAANRLAEEATAKAADLATEVGDLTKQLEAAHAALKAADLQIPEVASAK